VHDDGVYLMSNGEPRDIVEGESSFVAHAKGCNPKTDPDWWDVSRALVGGDDFGECLPWAKELKVLLDAEVVKPRIPSRWRRTIEFKMPARAR
jgi:hypothetical protein